MNADDSLRKLDKRVTELEDNVLELANEVFGSPTGPSGPREIPRVQQQLQQLSEQLTAFIDWQKQTDRDIDRLVTSLEDELRR